MIKLFRVDGHDLGCVDGGSPATIERVFPARADVIVALGGGITSDGIPRSATVARARRAAGLYRSGGRAGS